MITIIGIFAGIIILVILSAKGAKGLGHTIDARQHVDWVTRVNPKRSKPPPAVRRNPRISQASIDAHNRKVESEWAPLRKYVDGKVKKAEDRARRAQIKGKENLLHGRAIRKAREAQKAVQNSEAWEKSFTERILGTHRLSSGGNVSTGFQRRNHKPGSMPVIRGKPQKTVSGTLRKIIVGGNDNPPGKKGRR